MVYEYKKHIVDITCKRCKKIFQGRTKQTTCLECKSEHHYDVQTSYVICEDCGIILKEKLKRYCVNFKPITYRICRECARKYRKYPDYKIIIQKKLCRVCNKIISESPKKIRHNTREIIYRRCYECSCESMRKNNPMKKPEVRKKVTEIIKNRPRTLYIKKSTIRTFNMDCRSALSYWIKEVLTRDNNICRLCDRPNRIGLQVHDGITLCRGCHSLVDYRYRKEGGSKNENKANYYTKILRKRI